MFSRQVVKVSIKRLVASEAARSNARAASCEHHLRGKTEYL